MAAVEEIEGEDIVDSLAILSNSFQRIEWWGEDV
jgi:hypothetical protein